MNWFQKLYMGIVTSNDQEYIDRIETLKEEVKHSTSKVNILENEKSILIQSVIDKNKLINDLEKEIVTLKQTKDSQLEDYWNNKITPSIVYYGARRNESKAMDVRVFLNKNNDKVPVLKGKTNDYSAIIALRHVKSKIKYTQKLDKENSGEYWQYANETLELGTGDCEDGAILMANIMLKSGIPYWRIRVNAGDVTYQGGTTGHAYVTYLKESDNKWYVMDWCYWYKSSGTLWSTAKDYFGIWFSFNTKYGFKKAKLDR